MDFILEAYEQFKLQNIDDLFLVPMFNSGWAKLKKYYDLSDANPVHVAAIVLDPTLKWKYIDDHWLAEWVPRARESMQKIWDDNKPANLTAPLTLSQPPRSRAPNSFSVWIKERTDQRSTLDEYERYCIAPRA
jgi:hypothetical protein